MTYLWILNLKIGISPKWKVFVRKERHILNQLVESFRLMYSMTKIDKPLFGSTAIDTYFNIQKYWFNIIFCINIKQNVIKYWVHRLMERSERRLVWVKSSISFLNQQMLYINRKLSTSWFQICASFLAMDFHSGDIPVFRLKIQRGDPYRILGQHFLLLRFIYHFKACFILVLKMYELSDSDQYGQNYEISKWPIYQNRFSVKRL